MIIDDALRPRFVMDGMVPGRDNVDRFTMQVPALIVRLVLFIKYSAP